VLTIDESIWINAPVEQVFAFVAEPGNLLEIWPSLQDVRNVQPLPSGGYCYDWTYRMAGLRRYGHAVWVEFIKDQRMAIRTEGSILDSLLWTFQPEAAGTRLTVSAEYSIPGTALARLVEPVIHRMSEREINTILGNLKARMEINPQRFLLVGSEPEGL
jgi:carbon monoxide dehydrogenase subunit G